MIYSHDLNHIRVPDSRNLRSQNTSTRNQQRGTNSEAVKPCRRPSNLLPPSMAALAWQLAKRPLENAVHHPKSEQYSTLFIISLSPGLSLLPESSPVLSNSNSSSRSFQSVATLPRKTASLEFLERRRSNLGYEPFTPILSPSAVTSLVLWLIFNTRE
jgi:hypothetical protein